MRISIALTALAIATTAHAGAVVGATEFTQLLNNGQLAAENGTLGEQLNQQLQQVQNQLDQYKIMERDINSLTPTQWQGAVNTLQQLQQITSTAQGFAYAAGNIADVFKQNHPSFADYTANGVTPQSYSKAYSGWNNEVNSSITDTLAQVQAHLNGMVTTANLIETLKAQSNNADGQKAAIQAGNQFAALMAQQLLLLRQMTAAQIQAQDTAIAAENSKKAAAEARAEALSKKTKTYYTGKEPRYTY